MLGNATEFCVRTCDGYFFPLIKSAQQTKQASCEYACPSAPVAYYHGASIESARNLSGEKYTSLPTAFRFREKVSPGCTCHPPEESQQHSLKIVKNDPTAHSGDIVVEQRGAFVYQGKQAVPIDRSRQLSASVRQNIHKMTAGPAPDGATDRLAQNNAETSAVTGSANGGPLTGAARPMGELDAASDNWGDAGRIVSSAMTALLFLVALLVGAAAALRRKPGLIDRLTEAFTFKTSAPTTIDLIEAAEAGSVGQPAPPLAWVWSAYRGVLEPADIIQSRLTSALDTAGENAPAGAQTNPARLLITGLTNKIVKMLRRSPGSTDRLMGFFGAGAPAAIDPSVSEGTTPANQAATPLAWVWSEYRGVVETVVDVSRSQSSSGPPMNFAVGNSIDTIRGEIAGFSST